jgi:Skp family chaperone for outer membrane proteins
MTYRVFASTAVCALALALGCDKKDLSASTQPAPRPPEVGIVDLDQVVTELGLAREMKTNLEVLQQQLNADLQARQTQLSNNLQVEAQRMGVKENVPMTPQQSQAMARAVQERQGLMLQLQEIAKRLYAQHQADWLKRFREALEPVVKDVGFARKTKLVVMKNDTILYSEGAIDLTSAVTEAARAKPPVVSPPSRPQLPTLNENPTTGPTAGPAAAPGLAPAPAAPATAPATAPAPAPAPGKK